MDKNGSVLEKNELEKLQEQQQTYNKYLLELGTIEVIINSLKEQLKNTEQEKNNILGDIKTIKEQAESFQEALVNKYGNIDVNLVTGEFITL